VEEVLVLVVQLLLPLARFLELVVEELVLLQLVLLVLMEL
jgi:hypothetical protein